MAMADQKEQTKSETAKNKAGLTRYGRAESKCSYQASAQTKKQIHQFYARSVCGMNSEFLCQIHQRSGFSSFMLDPSTEQIQQFYADSICRTDSAVVYQFHLQNGFNNSMPDLSAERIRQFYATKSVRRADSAVLCQ